MRSKLWLFGGSLPTKSLDVSEIISLLEPYASREMSYLFSMRYDMERINLEKRLAQKIIGTLSKPQIIQEELQNILMEAKEDYECYLDRCYSRSSSFLKLLKDIELMEITVKEHVTAGKSSSIY